MTGYYPGRPWANYVEGQIAALQRAIDGCLGSPASIGVLADPDDAEYASPDDLRRSLPAIVTTSEGSAPAYLMLGERAGRTSLYRYDLHDQSGWLAVGDGLVELWFDIEGRTCSAAFYGPDRVRRDLPLQERLDGCRGLHEVEEDAVEALARMGTTIWRGSPSDVG